jgi:ribonuclease HI
MNTRQTIYLFTDGSANTKLKFGYGAFFVCSETEIKSGKFKPEIQIKRFESTSSSRLELQTVVWALSVLKNFSGKIVLFSDSENIATLAERRERLEKNNFYSNKNKKLNNHELYQKFYSFTDWFEIEIVKVQGHKKNILKTDFDRYFSYVDKASRKALREDSKST